MLPSTLLCKEVKEIRSGLKEEKVESEQDREGSFAPFTLEPFISCRVRMCYLFQKAYEKQDNSFERAGWFCLALGKALNLDRS